MQEGADDVTGLLIAALTASAHAIGRGSEGACLLYARCRALACTTCTHHMQEGADDVSGLLIAALTASAHAIGRGSEGACWLYVRCGALAADREPMAQPAASQLLWS